jgi:hypothetical protein
VGQCFHSDQVLSQSIILGKDQKRENQACRQGCQDMSRTSDLIKYGKPLRLISCVENTRHPSSTSYLTSTVASSDLCQTRLLKEELGEREEVIGSDCCMEPNMLNQKQVVEEGVFCVRQRMTVVLVFELYPIWLNCLNKLSCKELLLLGFATKSQLLAHIAGNGFSTELNIT